MMKAMIRIDLLTLTGIGKNLMEIVQSIFWPEKWDFHYAVPRFKMTAFLQFLHLLNYSLCKK